MSIAFPHLRAVSANAAHPLPGGQLRRRLHGHLLPNPSRAVPNPATPGPGVWIAFPHLCTMRNAKSHTLSGRQLRVDCTVFGPACQSIHVGTCFVQCNPTHGQPQCPFPTEVTCNPVCHRTFAQPCVASPAPACGPNVTIGGCSVACLPGQFPGQPGPVAQAALARGVAPAAQQITLGGPACGGTVGNFCTVFGPCDLWTTDTICCPIGNWTFNCPPTPVNPCVTQHPLQCTLACTRPPQCIVETMNALCVTRNLLHCSVVCTQPGQCLQSVNHCVTVFATCVTCNPAFCQIGPGQVPPGTPVEQRQAFVSAGPDCSIAGNCTRFTPCLI